MHHRLILVKPANSIQLAHLYEHIFCAHLDKWLFEKNIYHYLDYSLIAKTFYGGVITIDLELYTEKAIKVSQQIPELELAFDESAVSTAASQLLAEREVPYGNTGYNNVVKALETLHKQPWQNIDQFGLLDTKSIRRVTSPFYIAEGKPLLARKLSLGITLDNSFSKSHRELLPLFRQFAWLAISNLQSELADAYGYYSLKDSYKSSARTEGLFNTFNVANGHEVELSKNIQTSTDMLYAIHQQGGFKSLTEELRQTSYSNRSHLAPSTEKNYEDTLIFIGSKGWRDIATAENCNLIIQHMAVEISFGRQKSSRPFIDKR